MSFIAYQGHRVRTIVWKIAQVHYVFPHPKKTGLVGHVTLPDLHDVREA